jgi:hypothetical protein
MNSNRRRMPSHRRLLLPAAVALLLAGSGGHTLAVAAEPSAAALGSLPAITLPVSNRIGGQSMRDIQREAELREQRRQRRRIHLNGDPPTPVLRAFSSQPPPRAGTRPDGHLLLVVALCAVLALPLIASRLSSRRTA